MSTVNRAADTMSVQESIEQFLFVGKVVRKGASNLGKALQRAFLV